SVPPPSAASRSPRSRATLAPTGWSTARSPSTRPSGRCSHATATPSTSTSCCWPWAHDRGGRCARDTCGGAAAIRASSTRSSRGSSPARFEALPWRLPAAPAGRCPPKSLLSCVAGVVAVYGGVEPTDDPRDDPDPAEPVRLVLAPADPTEMPPGGGSTVGFDRLISLPTVDGPFLAGVKTDAAGFIEVDEGLKVCASERVWAAGGCIAAALELSALGALQADAAIGAIAAAITGTEGDGAAWSSAAPELTGMLLSDQREQWLCETPAGTPQPSTRCLWWPPGRAVGRMLAQQIAAWDPSVHQALPDHTTGLPIHAPGALGCSEPTVGAGTEVTAVDRTARLRDIEQRQLMAITRREHAADAELRALDARLQTLKAHQKAVIGELRQHGYLTHRA